jgi:Ca2+-dependent lipid-binding protein
LKKNQKWNQRSIRNITDDVYKKAKKAAIDADMETGEWINKTLKEKLERPIQQ